MGWRLRDVPLRWKLLLAFAAVLIIMVVLSAVTYQAIAVNDQTAALVDHTQAVITTADEALAALVDMESGYRGFLLTGREDFLEPYTSSAPVYYERLETLQQLTADNPPQVARWQALEQQAATWQRDVVEPGIRLRRQGGADAAAALAGAAEGKRQLDSMRQLFATASSSERTLLAHRTAQAAAANRRAREVLLGGTAGALGLAALIAVLLARDLATVADRLVQATDRVAAGDLQYRIRLRRRDELGRTAAAFDRMAERLEAIAAERGQALAALQAANAELEQFAYTVSHDLKAPLVTIQGFAHRLEKDYAARFDDAGRRYLGRIGANATHLGELIEDVLTFSRVGRIGAPPATVDLDALLRRLLGELQGVQERTGATVHAVAPLPAVVASPTLLEQILGNLLANALTYGAAPGEAPVVEVGCEDRGEEWWLYVRDHGPGIPADQQGRLFRLFERLPAGKAANPQGTGLGLATVRKAAEAMGGAATLESRPGTATTFGVRFPKAPPPDPTDLAYLTDSADRAAAGQALDGVAPRSG
jgi:signal transduction histidine kinase